MMRVSVYMICVLVLSAKFLSAQATYPKVTGYVGIVHPIVTFSGGETTTNFNHYYVVGMPTGINLWKNPKLGFSMEFVPYVRAENGTSKMNNFLFHPGVLVALGKGFTF
eukprot:gene56407-77304_t